jgi:hypothetical protein
VLLESLVFGDKRGELDERGKLIEGSALGPIIATPHNVPERQKPFHTAVNAVTLPHYQSYYTGGPIRVKQKFPLPGMPQSWAWEVGVRTAALAAICCEVISWVHRTSNLESTGLSTAK